MNTRSHLHRPHRAMARGLGVAAAVLLLAACGGGAGGLADRDPAAAAVSQPSGADRFLLFPNAQGGAGFGSEIDSLAYAQAYYAAIDPANNKATLADWKRLNGFDGAAGEQQSAVFADLRDLGYGRRVTGRRNADGSLAFMVENYLVNPGGDYGDPALSLRAAVLRDERWVVGINAIEVSPGPQGGAGFAKFYNFNPRSGQRELTVDLDGRGQKALPGVCVTCHGGRGDGLVPDAAGSAPVFNQVRNTASNHRGDVQGRLHPFEVPSFGFSDVPGFTRAEQEAALKRLNLLVLCSYPRAAADPPAPPGMGCSRTLATAGEWPGTAAALIHNAYGGNTLPNAQYQDTYLPDEWVTRGQATLYQEVVAKTCRSCHLLRGTGEQHDIDFDTLTKFEGYAERIKTHVFERGTMPLSKLNYDAFFASTAPQVLATFLEARGVRVARDANGAPLAPGRPIADPGPGRVVKARSVALTAQASLYADSVLWSVVSTPAGASAGFSDTRSMRPTLAVNADGRYVLRLVASRSGRDSEPASMTVVVAAGLAPAPADIRLADIRAALAAASPGDAGCVSCHRDGSGTATPVYFDNPSATGLRTDLLSRINFSDVAASPLLEKPAGRHHGGNARDGFNTALLPGDGARAKYDLFLNWILNGAPL